MPNPGHLPRSAKGKRVRGYLANGMAFGFEPLSATTPAGWAAESARWSRTRGAASGFDIDKWEIAA